MSFQLTSFLPEKVTGKKIPRKSRGVSEGRISVNLLDNQLNI